MFCADVVGATKPYHVEGMLGIIAIVVVGFDAPSACIVLLCAWLWL